MESLRGGVQRGRETFIGRVTQEVLLVWAERREERGGSDALWGEHSKHRGSDTDEWYVMFQNQQGVLCGSSEMITGRVVDAVREGARGRS